ncbi:hypothetical protein RB595_005985 [Gaeumannomyces hyphopodioides]
MGSVLIRGFFPLAIRFSALARTFIFRPARQPPSLGPRFVPPPAVVPLAAGRECMSLRDPTDLNPLPHHSRRIADTGASLRMPIHLRLATAADVPAIARIGTAAFDPSTDALTAALWPEHLRRGADPHPQEAWRAARKMALLKDENAIVMVAVEQAPDDAETVVGFAWWTGPGVPAHGGSDEGPGETDPPEMDRDVMAAMRERLVAAEGAIFGEGVPRHWYELEVLAVDPNHYRKGIGKQLTEWGLEMAAREQKDVFLSSTPAGNPLYTRLGFKPVGDLKMFGGTYPFMVLKNNPDSVIGTYTHPSN